MVPFVKVVRVVSAVTILASSAGIAFSSPVTVSHFSQGAVTFSASSPVTVPPLPPTVPGGRGAHLAAMSPVTVPPLPPTVPGGRGGHVAV